MTGSLSRPRTHVKGLALRDRAIGLGNIIGINGYPSQADLLSDDLSKLGQYGRGGAA